MKLRTLTQTIKRAIRTFPAVVITGPRQSGKTTLLKKLFTPQYHYLNLENIETRQRAIDDPVGFIKQNQPPLIIDEIQYAPQLLSYLKTEIDKDRRPGNWLLTGSQNFPLMKGVSQTLAGRAAVLSLLPFSLAEAINKGKQTKSVSQLLKDITVNKKLLNYDLDNFIFRGLYPEIDSNPKVDRQIWCNSYIITYLERDIRNLEQIGDLNLYQRFIRACAVRTGQILNLSEIAKEIGVAFTTARRWLSLLETGYQVLLLYPYYRNLGKRLIKSPKIYFTDTGLASFLMGFDSKKTLVNSPYFAHLFETIIVVDFWKRFLHFGDLPSMYYLRTRDGLEIDLVIELGDNLYLFEIKGSSTITSQHASSLKKALLDLKGKVKQAYLISNSAEIFELSEGILNLNWQTILLK